MTENGNSFEVLIDGKVYHLSGADQTYLQHISAYLNQKIKECKASAGYRGFDADYRALLLNLNISDDYFKAADENAELRKKNEEQEKELYALRHEIVSAKLKLENSLKQQEILETSLKQWQEKCGKMQKGTGY